MADDFEVFQALCLASLFLEQPWESFHQVRAEGLIISRLLPGVELLLIRLSLTRLLQLVNCKGWLKYAVELIRKHPNSILFHVGYVFVA